jgi:hypothetical protein
MTERLDVAFDAEGAVTLRGWLELISGGHFDAHLSDFPQAGGAARAWFREHLT